MTDEEKDQLDRIERKLDRILFLLGDGKKDMRAEARRILQLKLQPKEKSLSESKK